MNLHSELRRDRITGYLVLVIGFAISILMGWNSVRPASQSSTLGTFVSYWSHPAQSLSLRDATNRIAPRDPVFYMDSSGNCQFAGYVRTASESDDQDLESQNRDVTLCWCLPTVAPESMSWTLYENRGSFSTHSICCCRPRSEYALSKRFEPPCSSMERSWRTNCYPSLKTR